MSKLSNLFIYFSIVIFSIVLFIYLCTSNFLLFIILLCLCFIVSKNNKIKHFGFILFIISFLVRILFIIVVDFPQLHDFETLLMASKMFSHGDYSFNQWWHFYTWGYQTGFVIYQGFLLKLFNSVFLLKLLNVLYSSFLVLFIYKISIRISDEKSARFVSLLYMVFPFYIFMNTILANHHLATLLMYLGILFLIKKDKSFKDYVFGAILIGFGNIIRPEGIIVVLSLIVYEVFLINKEKIFKVIIHVCAFLIIYFSIGFLGSFLVIKSGVNPAGLRNHDPLWKFILGFNYNSCGYYDDSDSQYQVDRETEISIIKERVFSNLPRTGKLMICKIDHFWLSSDLNLESESYNDKTINIGNVNIKFSSIFDKVVSFNSSIQIFILIMFILGLFVNRKKIPNEALFLIIMCVITFFVFLFIEIQPRYAYFIHVSLFILASLGIRFIYNVNIKNILKKVL